MMAHSEFSLCFTAPVHLAFSIPMMARFQLSTSRVACASHPLLKSSTHVRRFGVMRSAIELETYSRLWFPAAIKLLALSVSLLLPGNANPFAVISIAGKLLWDGCAGPNPPPSFFLSRA